MVTLLKILERLHDHGIEFVLIGGMAAVLHGSSQVTQDVDVCMVLDAHNIARLRTALADLNPRHRMTPAKHSFLEIPPIGAPLKNIYLRTELGVLDIISEVVGVGDFAAIRERAEWQELGGRRMRVLSLRDLIACKETLRRDKDLLVAKELRLIARQRGLLP
jgi:predicted nucleotidyltransferase